MVDLVAPVMATEELDLKLHGEGNLHCSLSLGYGSSPTARDGEVAMMNWLKMTTSHGDGEIWRWTVRLELDGVGSHRRSGAAAR